MTVEEGKQKLEGMGLEVFPASDSNEMWVRHPDSGATLTFRPENIEDVVQLLTGVAHDAYHQDRSHLQPMKGKRGAMPHANRLNRRSQ